MSKSATTLIALAVGAAIGATAGLLYAPESGEKTRKKIKKQARKAQRDMDEQARKTYAEVSQKAAQFTSSLNSTATELKGSIEDRIETALSSASYKADEAILALEAKLEQLREQNAKLQKSNASKEKA
ncbi:YtxH domain-containing protein [Nonlabens sp.]|uniref:YtxH domain-containing protein n=1 Tax=Nonlabens sp. TaxID=1888209 RepID=UPI001BCBA56C|nr:YtxH domain-containing protein [Nonlabens sp.]